ncbi:jg26569 [Pararge aegeria aegeria]|uniref:Jg26569 protein n=1 Tax=Pararge aegeria aegeria TaxID=348720 RepID=A0A8S4S9H5_9NEOP|nr:jg26569 [Pararge aegeria aegeria]
MDLIIISTPTGPLQAQCSVAFSVDGLKTPLITLWRALRSQSAAILFTANTTFIRPDVLVMFRDMKIIELAPVAMGGGKGQQSLPCAETFCGVEISQVTCSA